MERPCNGPDEVDDFDDSEPYDSGPDFDPAYADRAAADWLADRLGGPQS